MVDFTIHGRYSQLWGEAGFAVRARGVCGQCAVAVLLRWKTNVGSFKVPGPVHMLCMFPKEPKRGLVAHGISLLPSTASDMSTSDPGVLNSGIEFTNSYISVEFKSLYKSPV